MAENYIVIFISSFLWINFPFSILRLSLPPFARPLALDLFHEVRGQIGQRNWILPENRLGNAWWKLAQLMSSHSNFNDLIENANNNERKEESERETEQSKC